MKNYRDRGLPLLDLVQEGALGLIRAMEKSDYRKGVKFATYLPPRRGSARRSATP